MPTNLPESIGKFRIIQPIRDGGMGKLYLARDPDISRQVAIKLMREGADDDELRERFIREAQSASTLRHDHIVTIFETGTYDGLPFIVMEYIQGDTLGDIIKQRTEMPVARKLQLLEELCDGMDYAHRKRVIHRDIKPANVMIDDEGKLRILDFGIARLGTGFTAFGKVMGTPNYMAPEQWDGHGVDGRSDIFAAGALAYEFFSYQRAFPGNDLPSVMRLITTGSPRPLRDVSPGIDAELAKIIERCLARDPKQRFQTFGELLKCFAAVRERLVQFIEDPERERAERIRRHVETARQAFEGGRYAAALSACKEALLLDPSQPEARGLAESARISIEHERVMFELLTEAKGELDRGAVTSASLLADRALSLDPDSAQAIALREAVDQMRRRLAEERERQRQLREALDAAQRALATESFSTVTACLDRVFQLEPNNAEGLALRDRAAAAQAARQKAELEARNAQAAIEQARRQFAAGDHTGAIARLVAFQPQALVANMVDDLRAELIEMERLREAERQRREIAEKLAEERQREEERDRRLAAERLADERRRDEERRQAEARRIADEVRRAKEEDKVKTFILPPVEPERDRLARERLERETLERERLEREKREREKRDREKQKRPRKVAVVAGLAVAALIAAAVAVVLIVGGQGGSSVNSADSELSRIQTLLTEGQEAAAVAALTAGLQAYPTDTRFGAVVQTLVTQAQDRLRTAKAPKASAAGTTEYTNAQAQEREAGDLIAARRPLEALAVLRRAADSFDKVSLPPPPVSSEAAVSQAQRLVDAGLDAEALQVIVDGRAKFPNERRLTALLDRLLKRAQEQALAAKTAAAGGVGTPGYNAAEAKEREAIAQASANQTVQATTLFQEAATLFKAALPPPTTAVDVALRNVQTLVDRRADGDALNAIADAVRRFSGDRRFDSPLRTLLDRAKAQSDTARTAAGSYAATKAFRDGTDKERQAAARSPLEAIPLYSEAAALFRRAETEAAETASSGAATRAQELVERGGTLEALQAILDGKRAYPAETRFESLGQRLLAKARDEMSQARDAVAATARATPNFAAAMAEEQQAAAAGAQRFDEATRRYLRATELYRNSTAVPPTDPKIGIDAVLDSYRAAHETVNAQGLKTVFPSLNLAGITEAFKNFRSIRKLVDLRTYQVAADGQSATVTAVERTSYVVRAGGAVKPDERPVRFTLRKTGNSWIIDSRTY
jgi:hypothetical protein